MAEVKEPPDSDALLSHMAERLASFLGLRYEHASKVEDGLKLIREELAIWTMHDLPRTSPVSPDGVEALETEEFYELMEQYRQAPFEEESKVVTAYEAVKNYIRRHVTPSGERVRELERLLRESICDICHYAYGEDVDDARNPVCDEGNCKAARGLLEPKGKSS